MDDKIKEALTRQVEKEPFVKKFGLNYCYPQQGIAAFRFNNR